MFIVDSLLLRLALLLSRLSSSNGTKLNIRTIIWVLFGCAKTSTLTVLRYYNNLYEDNKIGCFQFV